MPLQNRVRPDGVIVADPARGTMMGNRGGRLHDPSKRLGRRRWVGRAWICCLTSFGGRHREVMGPGYTELFFLDEATALAAGHRPCFECRRDDAVRFATLWKKVRGRATRARIAEIDQVLHAQRRACLTMRPAAGDPACLPDGTFVSDGRAIQVVWNGQARPWSMAGYGHTCGIIPGSATSSVLRLLTPSAIVDVLCAGYRPQVHPSLAG